MGLLSFKLILARSEDKDSRRIVKQCALKVNRQRPSFPPGNKAPVSHTQRWLYKQRGVKKALLKAIPKTQIHIK